MFLLRKLPIVFAVLICVGRAANAQSTNAIADALGPQWKLMSRASGAIFAGTVISIDAHATSNGSPIPTIELRFRVDKAIAGVRPGQVVTIREWAGAWDSHRPMRVGQHFLLFFHPPSSLGLTSPVGGARGQIELDPGGRIPVPQNETPTRRLLLTGRVTNTGEQRMTVDWERLRRAVRRAREESR